MPTSVFKMAMNGPLRIGRSGVGEEETHEYYPSDSLFSALVVTWLELGEQAAVHNLTHEFAADATPPLLLTSAFPFAGEVLLLPKPHLPVHPRDGGKGYKGVQWVSPQVFARLIAGMTADGLTQLWQETQGPQGATCLVQNGRVWVAQEERAAMAAAAGANDPRQMTLWASDQTPHVAVDRLTNAGNLYHVGQVRFAPGCGLWCMATGEETWLRRTGHALQHLADAGIGGGKSRGRGRFTLEVGTTPPNLGQAGAYQVLLSRLAPTATQMPLLRAPSSRYDLVTVGGFSTYPGRRPVVRKRLRLLREGSIIARADHAAGQLVDVAPDGAAGPPLHLQHPIWRYGFGYGVECAPAQEEVRA